MAFHDRVKVFTATKGQGPVTVGAALLGFRDFSSAGTVTGERTSNLIECNGNFEQSIGIYNDADKTVTRTLLWSTTGALLDLDGTATVTQTFFARDMYEPKQSKIRISGDVQAPFGAFVDFDPTGAFDLDIEGQALDWLEFRINGQAGDNEAITSIEFNIDMMIGDTRVGRVITGKDSNTPIGSLSLRPNDYDPRSGTLPYVAQSKDVSPLGRLKARLLCRSNGSGGRARKIFASDQTVPFQWDVKNTGPARVNYV